MRIVASTGKEEVAIVYIAEFGADKMVECVEALQPPLPREKKWVLLISTLYGCPVRCMMCDAGGYFHGKLSKEEIFAQIDFLVQNRFPDGYIPSANFKIQFARMGEPSLNPNVLDVLDELPSRYHAPGLIPSFSTIAPCGTEQFFQRLLEIKQDKYSGGHFQFQFSIHTTDEKLRDKLIPVRKWGFPDMAEYGIRFFKDGDRKITLNFALAHGNPVESGVLLKYFDPGRFLIKITPLNPTYQAMANGLTSYLDPLQSNGDYEIVKTLRRAGYEVLISIGEVEENNIGSNCGQYLLKHLKASECLKNGYTYQISECDTTV